MYEKLTDDKFKYYNNKILRSQITFIDKGKLY